MQTSVRRIFTTYGAISLFLLGQLFFTATSGFSAVESIARPTPRKVIAVIPADLPPTYFLDKSGTPAGFAIDVMNELALRSDLAVEYVTTKGWDEAIQLVLAGKADLIPSLTINEQRMELLAFTKTVDSLRINLVVTSGNNSIQGIAPGLTIGVLKGSAPHIFLKNNQTIKLETFNDLQTMLFELLAGHVDGIVSLTSNIMKLAADAGIEEKVKVIGKPVIEAKRGIALRKEETELLTSLNKVIDDFVDTPDYRQIYVKWYGKPKSYWTGKRVGWSMGVLLVMLTAVFTIWRFREKELVNRRLEQTNNLLRESEKKYSRLIDTANEGVWVIDENRKTTFVNARLAEMLEYIPEEMIGQTLDSFVFKEDLADHAEKMEKRRHGKGEVYERRYKKKDGQAVWTLTSAAALMSETGQFQGGFAMITDITVRKQAEAERRESEDKYRTLFDNAGDSIFISDTEGKIVAVNEHACKTLGYTHAEFMTMAVEAVDTPEQSRFVPERIAQLMERGRIAFETVHQRKDGTPVPTDVTVSKITWGGKPAIMSICRDITERKRAEEERRSMELQLQQAQKLESLGVLAGGIAHDFNNILMAIMGNADLALMRINKESPAVDNLKRIEQSAARAADLAKQMLAYSGKGKFVVEHIDMSRLVEEMLNMVEVSISKKAVLRLNLTSLIPSVEADATQLRQIIMNLVINASEAIGEKSGVIAINTGCMECDKNYLTSVWLDENLGTGLYVYLEVSDTGCGMDKDTLAKLFDPFFTTKFTGRGLGMAAVLGIVRGHKGAIRVYSEPDKGSSFKILLPAVDRPVEIFNGGNQVDDWRGEGTVLLVDDEETVRAIGSEMLRELGFQVVTAEDGRDAVELFKSRDDIDFVILDLTMPKMNGEQCFRELRKLKPEMKIIMSSGFNQQEVTQKFVGKGLSGFIQKPYRLSVLKEVIRGI